MNPTIVPVPMRKSLGRLGFLTLVTKTGFERKTEFDLSKVHLKIEFVLLPAYAEGLGKYIYI